MFDILGPAPRRGRPVILVAVPGEAQAFGSRATVVVTGVGKVAAATAASWVCLEHRPSTLLNVGTAGALRPDVAHGMVHEIGAVIQHDLDGRAIAALLGEDPSPRLELAGQGPVLATGDRFIASPAERDALAGHADLVDMEGYAVAAVAARLAIPVRLAKTVSDDAGHDAATSWADSLAPASRTLAGWLDEVLPGC